jgi:hypothetical protein
LQIPLGTAASHLARGKAAVAAYIDLVPELEKSLKKSLPATPSQNNEEIGGVVLGEVVE